MTARSSLQLPAGSSQMGLSSQKGLYSQEGLGVQDLGPLPPMGAPLLGSLGMMGVSMGPGPMGMGMPPPGLGLPSQGMMMMPNQGGGGMPNNGMGMSGPGPVHGMPRPPPGPPPGGPPGPKPFAGKQERDRQREMGPATSVTPKPEPDGASLLECSCSKGAFPLATALRRRMCWEKCPERRTLVPPTKLKKSRSGGDPK